MMYKIIQKHKPVRDLYRQQLIDQGIPEQDLKDIETSARTKMEEAYTKSKNLEFRKEEWMTEEWSKIKDTKF